MMIHHENVSTVYFDQTFTHKKIYHQRKKMVDVCLGDEKKICVIIGLTDLKTFWWTFVIVYAPAFYKEALWFTDLTRRHITLFFEFMYILSVSIRFIWIMQESAVKRFLLISRYISAHVTGLTTKNAFK